MHALFSCETLVLSLAPAVDTVSVDSKVITGTRSGQISRLFLGVLRNDVTPFLDVVVSAAWCSSKKSRLMIIFPIRHYCCNGDAPYRTLDEFKRRCGTALPTGLCFLPDVRGSCRSQTRGSMICHPQVRQFISRSRRQALLLYRKLRGVPLGCKRSRPFPRRYRCSCQRPRPVRSPHALPTQSGPLRRKQLAACASQVGG